MGCFSVSCGLSSLPIYNQNIYMMLLKQDKYAGSFEPSKNLIHGKTFVPASPLIAGKCDTYGNIEDIEEDEGFVYTCKMLGIEPTESAFHEWVESGWMEKPEGETKYWVTFFRREVVDAALEYCTKNKFNILNGYNQDWILKAFPEVFEYVTEIEGRYKYLYKMKDGRQIVSDGTWIHSFPENHGFYKTADLMSFIGNSEIVDSIMNSEKMKELTSKSTIEYEMLKQKKECLDYVNMLTETEKTVGKKLFNIDFMLDKDFWDLEIYPARLSDEEISFFVNGIMLSGYMYSCNRYFWPSFSGEQINSYEEISHMHEVVGKLIKQDINYFKGDD
jgi:hypothetical protein